MILYDFLKKNNLLNPELALVTIHWKGELWYKGTIHSAFRNDFMNVQVPDTVKILQYRYPTEFGMHTGDGKVFLKMKKEKGVLTLVLEYNG